MRKKKNTDPQNIIDEAAAQAGKQRAGATSLKAGKRLTRRELLRIKEVQDRLAESGEDIDAGTVVSMYMPRRRTNRLANALLRLDKLRLLLLILALVILLIFIFAFLQEKAGNFTINLDRLELFRKGIAISADAEFTAPTSRLTASEVPAATNISINDLPFDLDDIDGDHSGANYMAYTYYVRNAGKEDVNYIASLTIDDASKGVEDAVRVAVWHNGERTVYAEPAADGSAEDGCVSFVSRYLVFSTLEEDFLVGNVNKYTVVIWLEGDDPECVDAIVGGSIDFTMSIKAENEDDTSLLSKWVRDLFDTLSGNNPISAGGTESPDFYSDVNWWTRRNQ